MPQSPNKITQYWQELKRRKVVRVITVYAAAAFVILELTDIVAEPLKLPTWLLPFVIVLLSIGFIIAIILSWIYDKHPEGGMVKTGAVDKANSKKIKTSSNSWKIASYFSFLVIVAFVVFHLVGNNKESFDISKLEKSVAVLPLNYLSEDPNKQYLANGVLEAITGHLSTIEGLRVMPRTSVEQYRENRKSAKEIGEELDVSYLIEGSFLMIDDQVKLTIQLVVAEVGDHLIFREYDINYNDIIAVQSEVVQTIAKEIKVAITPEEKDRIEKVPTTSLTALDFYQRGREEYWRSRLNREYGTALKQAEFFFNKALENDPRYTLAYAGLAMVYYSKYLTTSRSGGQYSADYYLSVNLDSMNLLAQRAMDLDEPVADAYFAKGVYEQERGNLKEGLEYMNEAMKINPNHTLALTGAASIYGDLYDYVNGLTSLHKAASMERGSLLPVIYFTLYSGYSVMGFPEKSLHYLDEYLSLSGDSITYFIYRYAEELPASNQEKANKYAAAAYEVDSSNQDAILYMGRSNLDSKRYEEAYPYYLKYFNLVEAAGDLDVNDMNRMGHVLWMTGRKEEAQRYFQEMIYHCKRHIEINSSYGRQAASYDLAGVYAFIGEKDSAYYYLEEFSKTNLQIYNFIDWLNIRDPLFESIRQEDRFQKLLRDMEDKYQAEHERVRQWLEENDML
jgi:TolB-like protein